MNKGKKEKAKARQKKHNSLYKGKPFLLKPAGLLFSKLKRSRKAIFCSNLSIYGTDSELIIITVVAKTIKSSNVYTVDWRFAQ